MKKLLVMLLAVSMVLTMAFSFAACGGEEEGTSSEASSQAPADSSKGEDTSKEEASVVESSDEASKVESTEEESSVVESSDEESSAVESSDEESSAVESSDEESSAVESSEAPVESSEAPVESSEAPVESSEEVPSESDTPDNGNTDGSTGNVGGSDVVVPSGKTNYAAGASYTISKNLIPVADIVAEAGTLFLADASGATTYELWGDVGLNKLTDGKTAAGGDMGSNGSLEGVTVTFVGTNAIFEYVIDLGESKSDINSIVFCGVRDGVANENNRGFSVETTMFYTTDTLGTWGDMLTATFSKEELAGAPLIKHQKIEDSENVENYTYTFTLDSAATGRYVRILTSSPVYCLQFDEIMVLN